jgi:hypothetical protein
VVKAELPSRLQYCYLPRRQRRHETPARDH